MTQSMTASDRYIPAELRAGFVELNHTYNTHRHYSLKYNQQPSIPPSSYLGESEFKRNQLFRSNSSGVLDACDFTHQNYDDIDMKKLNGSVPSSPNREKEEKMKNSDFGTGLLRKFRSSKNSKHMKNEKIEPKLTKRAFAHYDCQSVCFNYHDIVRRRTSLNQHKNTKTGASAASVAQTSDYILTDGSYRNIADIEDDQDQGDGNSNDMVSSCPFFRNELGADENIVLSHGRSQCNGVTILDNSKPSSNEPVVLAPVVTYDMFVMEHVDYGAYYYRNFFASHDHQNFIGIDEDGMGPVAVSIKREKDGNRYQYRIILRTSEQCTLRGCIPEEAIASSKFSSSRGIPTKEILSSIVPELRLNNLKVAVSGEKTIKQMQRLDEQQVE